jgi:hypothetical protein
VMLGPVDQGHLHRRPRQPPGREQPGEPAPDDHYPAGARCCGHGSPRPFVASCGLKGHRDRASACGHRPDEGIAGAGALLAPPSLPRRGVTELVFVLVLRRIWIHQDVARAAWASVSVVCVTRGCSRAVGEPTGRRRGLTGIGCAVGRTGPGGTSRGQDGITRPGVWWVRQRPYAEAASGWADAIRGEPGLPLPMPSSTRVPLVRSRRSASHRTSPGTCRICLGG